MSIKRYDQDTHMSLDVDGNWISYEDYAALEQRNKELEAELVRERMRLANVCTVALDLLERCKRNAEEALNPITPVDDNNGSK